MTTVVGFARDGVVYMAADACVSVFNRPVLGAMRKILRLPAGDGEVLVGVSGKGGLRGCILAGLTLGGVPEGGTDPERWVHGVAVAITDLAKRAGLTADGKIDGALLLGWRGRLWTIGHSVAVWHPDGRAAIGSGEGPAIGALDALAAMGTDPWDAVARAAQIGIDRDHTSAGPIQVEVLGGCGREE